MDLSKLPSELIWAILDRLTTLQERKNASLVCRSWNRMLFNSPKAQHNLKLRICTRSRLSTEDYLLFSELFEVMIASERNYVCIEFCYVNFEDTKIASDFLLFIVNVCRQSLRSLKFESCGGLSRSLLCTALQKAQHLEELYVINPIERDETKVELFSLPALRIVALYINDNCQFYEDICWMAPRLEELRIRTRDGLSRTRKYVDTIERFCGQLKKFDFSSESALSDEVQMMPFQQLVSLKLDVFGIFNHKFIRGLQSLVNLELRGDVSDEIIHAVCDLFRLKSLKLKSNELYESSKISQLTKLYFLETLHISGIFNISWKSIVLPSLTNLHVESVGIGFSDFLKHSTLLKSLEVHDIVLSNKLLKTICNAVPTLERLELAKCSNITDAGLKNVAHLKNLRELRLWEINVSSKLFQRCRIAKKLLKLLIYFSSSADDAIVNEIAAQGDHLEQIVFYDCYSITEDAVEELRKRRPSCEVLRIYRGGPLPASLVHEMQIYCRNVDYPNGILKPELPFSWDSV